MILIGIFHKKIKKEKNQKNKDNKISAHLHQSKKFYWLPRLKKFFFEGDSRHEVSDKKSAHLHLKKSFGVIDTSLTLANSQ